jgi:hypothetical protein
MTDETLTRYLSGVKFRIGKRDRNNGLIGVSPVLDGRIVYFSCSLPSCLSLPPKRFATAVQAADYYNQIVVKHFGKYAVTCCLLAAKEMDQQYGKYRK